MKKAFLLLSFSIFVITSFAQSKKEGKVKTIYSQGFNNDKSTRDFEYTDASKWLISKKGKSGKSLKCLGKGQYVDANGGPSIMAILKNIEVKDFELELLVQQNGKNFDLLDFCIFYGIKDSLHYSYAQIAGHADKNTHNIFQVDATKPQRLCDKQNKGIRWGVDEWHKVKVVRNTSNQSLKVYFNDELILQTNEDTITSGYIGFGSTKSAIKVDNIKLMATDYTNNTTTIF